MKLAVVYWNSPFKNIFSLLAVKSPLERHRPALAHIVVVMHTCDSPVTLAMMATSSHVSQFSGTKTRNCNWRKRGGEGVGTLDIFPPSGKHHGQKQNVTCYLFFIYCTYTEAHCAHCTYTVQIHRVKGQKCNILCHPFHMDPLTCKYGSESNPGRT